jgi:ribulose-phosphate 3-epimerase
MVQGNDPLMKVVPAILAEKYDEFAFRLRQAESFVDYIQIDLMDGAFVSSVSIPGETLNSVKTFLQFEVHLMVKHPAAYMSGIDNPHLRKVIFHVESDVKHADFVTYAARHVKIVAVVIPFVILISQIWS